MEKLLEVPETCEIQI